jgi:hypothetical protein
MRLLLGFRVTVDGVPIKAEVESRAFANERDVTPRGTVGIRGGGDRQQGFGAFNPESTGHAQKEELIECDSEECFPLWESRAVLLERTIPGREGCGRPPFLRTCGRRQLHCRRHGRKANIDPFCGGPEDVTAIQQFKKRRPPKTADLPYLW